MKEKAIIFDLDGVLLDSLPYWNRLPLDYLSQHHATPASKIAEEIFDMSLPQAAAYLIQRHAIDQPLENAIDQLQAIISRHYQNDMGLLPYAKETLFSFHSQDIPCALATITSRKDAAAALQRLGLLPYFTSICCTESKQKPDVFFQAAQALGSLPQETLVLDDSKLAIQTAKGAGFLTYHVKGDLGDFFRRRFAK